MKTKILKKVFCLFFVFLFLFSAFPINVFAEEQTDLDKMCESSVMDDLESFGIDWEKYKKDVSATHCRMLFFHEFGYDYDGVSENYGLFVYIWNPSGKEIDISNGKNFIQMQTLASSASGINENGWLKYGLVYCDSSTDSGYENVFYKFRLVGINSVPSYLSRDVRHYEISGVELRFVGDSNATDFNVGGRYTYSGFMPYCGATKSAVSTLDHSVTDRTTIELELHPVSFKTQTSDKGAGYQYEIFSVYFAVPNDIIEDYGNADEVLTKGLKEINGKYDKHRINGIITNDESANSVINSYLGVLDNSYDPSVPIYFYSYKSTSSYIENPFNVLLDGDLEVNPYGSRAYCIIDRLCSSILYNGDFFEEIPTLDVIEQLEVLWNEKGFYCLNSCSDIIGPVLPNSVYGNDLEYSVEDGEDLAEQIATYASANRSKILAWLRGEGNLHINDEEYKDIQSIQSLSNDDFYLNGVIRNSEYLANTYYLMESEVDDLVEFVADSALADKTTYMMRFSVEDYYCADIYLSCNDKIYSEGNYYFEKTVFKDLDVMTFTFENQYYGETVIPVVCSPITHAGSLTPTRNPSLLGSLGDDLKKWWYDLTDLPDLLGSLKIGVVLLGIFLILFALSSVLKPLGLSLKWLFDGIGKIIAAPFKLLGKVDSSSKGSSKSKTKKESKDKPAASSKESSKDSSSKNTEKENG